MVTEKVKKTYQNDKGYIGVCARVLSMFARMRRIRAIFLSLVLRLDRIRAIFLLYIYGAVQPQHQRHFLLYMHASSLDHTAIQFPRLAAPTVFAPHAPGIIFFGCHTFLARLLAYPSLGVLPLTYGWIASGRSGTRTKSVSACVSMRRGYYANWLVGCCGAHRCYANWLVGCCGAHRLAVTEWIDVQKEVEIDVKVEPKKAAPVKSKPASKKSSIMVRHAALSGWELQCCSVYSVAWDL